MMRVLPAGWRAVYRRELAATWSQPVALVFMIAFLLSTSAFTFYLGDFFARGTADLTPFFQFHPWLFLLLGPALAMRQWAEEERSGTVELLLTLPITPAGAVMGKFLAAWSLALIALALTVPMWITVNWLGEPDNGVIAASYLGSALMLGGYIAIGGCLSAATRNQVTAFILAAMICFLMVAAGLPLVLDTVAGWLPQGVVNLIASFSFLARFEALRQGVLDLRDVLYFILVILAWLAATVILVARGRGRGMPGPGGRRLPPAAALVVLGGCFAAFVALLDLAMPRLRLDLTQEQRFTLSQGTRNILARIDEPITLTFYFSDKAATGLPRLKMLAGRIDDLLDEYAAAAGGKLILKRIDPELFSEAEDLAAAAGVQPLQLDDGRALFFGLTGSGPGPDREIIATFLPEREAQLEYDLTRLIHRLDTPVLPKVALLTSLPMAFGRGGALAMAQGRSAPYAAYQQLRQFFDVVPVDPRQGLIPPDAGVLILAHPPVLPLAMRYAIDQFVMRGGRLIVVIDPLNEAGLADETGPLGQAGPGAPPVSSDLSDLLRPWGVKLQPGKVVADLAFAQRVDMGGRDLVDYPAWLALDRTALNRDDMLTASIARLNLAEAGSLLLAPPQGVSISALIQSSDQAALVPVDALLSQEDPAALLRRIAPDGIRYVIAVRLAGTLPSAFGTSLQAPAGKDHIPRSRGMANVVVIADADWLEDRFWLRGSTALGGNYTEQIADNGAFLVNSVDALLGSTDLLSLRARRVEHRPFTSIEAIRQRAEIRLLKREAELQRTIAATQERIQALEIKGGSATAFLTPAQKAEIERFRDTVAATRLELRAVQHDLRRDVDRLTGRIAALNILGAPALLLVGWIVQRRFKRRGR